MECRLLQYDCLHEEPFAALHKTGQCLKAGAVCSTKTRDRLKLIPRVSNLEEWAKEGQLSGAVSIVAEDLFSNNPWHFHSMADVDHLDIYPMTASSEM